MHTTGDAKLNVAIPVAPVLQVGFTRLLYADSWCRCVSYAFNDAALGAETAGMIGVYEAT
jgi:hypothetical protein